MVTISYKKGHRGIKDAGKRQKKVRQALLAKIGAAHQTFLDSQAEAAIIVDADGKTVVNADGKRTTIVRPKKKRKKSPKVLKAWDPGFDLESVSPLDSSFIPSRPESTSNDSGMKKLPVPPTPLSVSELPAFLESVEMVR